jgi:hypothetical protein
MRRADRLAGCQTLATAAFILGAIMLQPHDASAQDATTTGGTASRPPIMFNRWQEDWSVLADPALRTEPLDSLKYIPLIDGDPDSYISLGGNLRERFEYLGAPSFGVGKAPFPGYVIQRLEAHADIHPTAGWEAFIQLEDDRAFAKTPVSPVDQDRLDLEQAFLLYRTDLFGGEFTARVGRQELGFDLQRFVAVRDGPNVRQAFDAVWFNWTAAPWRVIAFWSHPVQNVDTRAFDDYSDHHFQYGGFRVERQAVGPGDLSIYYSRYDLDNAHFLAASGRERRDILDTRYAGKAAGFDWDAEAMGQTGTLGPKRVLAWAVGAVTGYTLPNVTWSPRVGLQVDAASGTRHLDSDTVSTLNPLFINGYYFTLAGFTGYTNLYHVKPSLTIHPASDTTILAALGFQWRQTTGDAVYLQPDTPVKGTAGGGTSWTGAYAQLRIDHSFTSHISGALEAVRYDVGSTIRHAGGSDSDYLGVELKFGW